MSDRAETLECVKSLKALLSILSVSELRCDKNALEENEWDLLQIEEEIERAQKAVRLFDVAEHPIMKAHDQFVAALKAEAR